MSELRACGVLVVRSAADRRSVDEFLLMRHTDRWDLPKGHVEAGEDDIACALRELEEETGIPADCLEMHPTFRFTTRYTVVSARTGGEPRLKTVVIFLAWLTQDVPIATSEHEGYRWFPWRPGLKIQERTIDPLLQTLEKFLASGETPPE